MQSSKLQELENKVADRIKDIEEFAQTLQESFQAASEADLLKVKTIYIIAFKWLYEAFIERCGEQYQVARGNSKRKLNRETSSDEKTLIEKLRSITLKDTLQSSYQDLSTPFVEEIFELIAKFLAPENLAKDARLVDFNCLVSAQQTLRAKQHGFFEQLIAIHQGEIADLFLQSNQYRHPLSKETVKRRFSILLGFIEKARVLLEDKEKFSQDDERQYRNAKVAPAIIDNLFHSQESEEFLNLLDCVKQVTLSGLSTSAGNSQTQQTDISSSRYDFSLHHSNAIVLKEVFRELRLNELPCISEKIQIIDQFNETLNAFSKLVVNSISDIHSKLVTCKEEDLFEYYTDLTQWRWAAEFLINYNLGEKNLCLFSDNIHAASDSINEIIKKVISRVEKPLKDINEDFNRLTSASINIEAIQHSVKLHTEQMRLLGVMNAAKINEQEVSEFKTRYMYSYRSHLEKLIEARMQALDAMCQELQAGSRDNESITSLEQLLSGNKKKFEQECELQEAMLEFCAVHGYQDVDAYEDKLGQLKRCRQEIGYKIEDIKRDTARSNLEEILKLLKQMIDSQNIVVQDFTRNFNRLYTKVEEYHKVEASVNERTTVPDLFDGFIAELLPEKIYQVASLRNPAIQPISSLEYQTIKMLMKAVKNSDYAQRDIVKKHIDAFEKAETELKEHIAQIKVRLTETGKEIHSCTTENYSTALRKLTEDNQYISENFLGGDPTDKSTNPDHFLCELMKAELVLHARNFEALLARKKVFEESYDKLIQAEADKIIRAFESAVGNKELDDQLIFQQFQKIYSLREKCASEGLVPPTQGFLKKFEAIQALIGTQLENRKKHLVSLLERKPENIDEEFITKMKQQLAAEYAHLQKLVAIRNQLPKDVDDLESFNSILDEYQVAIEEFEQAVNDLDFKRVFTQKIRDLEDQNKESLVALNAAQKQELIATLESMNQIVAIRKETHSLENDPLIERAKNILRTINGFLSSYYDECSKSVLEWLRSTFKTVGEARTVPEQFTQRVDYLVELHKKMCDLAQTFGIEMWKNTLTSKTLEEFLGQQKDHDVIYQGTLNLISLEKWKMINQIFDDSGKFTYTARLWTTPTGINELLSLKKRWDQLGNQQLVNLDYYFARVKKIISDRLDENPENKDSKRTTETHNFYRKCESDIAALQLKEKKQWGRVIMSALALGRYADAQVALAKTRLPHDQVVGSWADLTALIFEKVCTSGVSEQERNTHIINALRAAKKQLLQFSAADQIRFYDELLARVNVQQKYDPTQIQKILFLARSLEDAHDPEREEHAWFGRATGVEEIVQEMPEPVYFLYEFFNKNNETTETSESVWTWVDRLIQQLIGIVSSRLDLTKEKTSRHAETQQFYLNTNDACAELFPGLAKTYKDATPQLRGSFSEYSDTAGSESGDGVEFDEMQRQQVY